MMWFQADNSLGYYFGGSFYIYIFSGIAAALPWRPTEAELFMGSADEADEALCRQMTHVTCVLYMSRMVAL